MARFPLMIGVAVFCLAPFGVQAQTPHPVAPGMRTTPARTAPPASQPGNATVVATAPPANSSAAPAPNPAIAPTVIFRDGLLTVQTTNSSLSSVVMAIRNKTGIEFEGVEGGSSEHVALSLGPAPEGDVLSAIFSGSKYDFVAIDRPDAPGIVQKVIVSVKNRSGSPDAPQQPRPAGQEADDDDTPDEQVNTEPQDTPVQPPPVQQPQHAPQAQQQPKSPEQLLQELQQMQQQKSGTSDPNAAQAPRKVPQ
jgi:hypothetical protein